MLPSGVKVVSSQVSHQLYSTIIPPADDGFYSFQYAALLGEHEPLRREVLRLQRALFAFSPSSAPWKLICLQQWTQNYLFPVILLFERNKRDFLASYYSKLGHVIPESLGYNNQRYFNDPIGNTTQLTGQIALDLENKALTKHLIEAISEFVKVFQAHWDEEERFWVDIVSQHSIHHVFTQSHPLHMIDDDGKVGQLLAAAYLHGLGHVSNEYNYHDEFDIPWCGQKMRLELMKQANTIQNMTEEMKLLDHYRWMLDAIRGDKNFFKRMNWLVLLNERRVAMERVMVAV